MKEKKYCCHCVYASITDANGYTCLNEKGIKYKLDIEDDFWDDEVNCDTYKSGGVE